MLNIIFIILVIYAIAYIIKKTFFNSDVEEELEIEENEEDNYFI